MYFLHGFEPAMALRLTKFTLKEDQTETIDGTLDNATLLVEKFGSTEVDLLYSYYIKTYVLQALVSFHQTATKRCIHACLPQTSEQCELTFTGT